MKYELIIFDMDGTILNTLDDMADCLNHVLEANGFPKRTLSEVRSFVGNGIKKLVERGIPEGTPQKELEKVLQDFQTYYKAHCADKTQPYDGIVTLLKKLRLSGYQTAVVSNKIDDGVQALCRQYFNGLFDMAVGEQPSVRQKPAPDSVNKVLETLHVDRSKAVYIGDSEVDLATAQNACMDCIAVDWGFRDVEYLKSMGDAIIVSIPDEILGLV